MFLYSIRWRRPSNEEYSEIVNQLLGFLKINSVDIFSHDLGVSVIQKLLAREPENKNGFQIRSFAFMKRENKTKYALLGILS
ncbi:hypothetical protein [Leptospira ilyithenensis]|uniref:hypothetical protein n=1 Tax=Leptospira ilyithenensis TaxID=2484901 RepID=UPI001FE44B5B|nr:hypothetical protein [Leptospira ilyithenensis]